MKLIAKKAPSTSELGAYSVKIDMGYVSDDYTPSLRDNRKRHRIFKEMADNDPTVGAVLKWIKSVIAGVNWKFSTPDNEYNKLDESKKLRDWFSNAIFNDMNMGFGEVMDDVLTMLEFGWAYFEIIYKKRMLGNSKYPDSKFGIKKIAIRDQESLDHWEIDEQGDILGLWQRVYSTSKYVFIPMEKSLLFRSSHNRNNPEGYSILRNAYTPWFFMKNIQVAEAIGIERNLAGLPVFYIPGDVLTSTDASDKLVVSMYRKILENMKMNERSGLILPSDTYTDSEGNPTNVQKVRLELLSSNSQKVIDTNSTVSRYENSIARSMLADFIMLGSKRTGSYALSNDKTDMFECSIQEVLRNICYQFNGKLIPRLCEYNGFDVNCAPYIKPGSVSREELSRLSTFLRELSSAGAPIFPDDDLENYLRNIAGLPEVSLDRGSLLNAMNESGDSALGISNKNRDKNNV